MKRAALALCLFTLPAGLAFAGWSCGSSSEVAAVETDAAARLDGVFRVDAACLVTIETPPLQSRPHVATGTDVVYNSNPPSSGPHYATWAGFQEYDKPVDRRYYVHSLEHGAIVIAYKCDNPTACAPLVEAARRAANSIPDDPSCAGTGARVRVLITPDPLLDVPLAVAAWGWIYKAACVDDPSLQAFARDHYARAPEDLCSAGETQF